MKITKEGFVWLVIPHDQVNGYPTDVYLLHDDESESLVELSDEILPTNKYAIEIGHLPEHLIKAMSDDKKCVIRWGEDDVRGRSDSELNDEQVQKVLDDMSRSHDANVGVNWVTIDFHIGELAK